MNYLSHSSLFVGFFLISSCQSIPQNPVGRHESIWIANSYATLRWNANPTNIRHQKDSKGIQIDTPNASSGLRASWWSTHEQNIGMPYKWGGFDSPSEFLVKISQGYAAGDIMTADKRIKGNAAVSDQATGIDCSGFISKCWKLPKAYSSHELQKITHRLSAWKDLQKGDILLLPGKHVVIFDEWADYFHTELVCWEAGSKPEWKVDRKQYPLNIFVQQGYYPARYINIQDDEPENGQNQEGAN